MTILLSLHLSIHCMMWWCSWNAMEISNGCPTEIPSSCSYHNWSVHQKMGQKWCTHVSYSHDGSYNEHFSLNMIRLFLWKSIILYLIHTFLHAKLFCHHCQAFKLHFAQIAYFLIDNNICPQFIFFEWPLRKKFCLLFGHEEAFCSLLSCQWQFTTFECITGYCTWQWSEWSGNALGCHGDIKWLFNSNTTIIILVHTTLFCSSQNGQRIMCSWCPSSDPAMLMLTAYSWTSMCVKWSKIHIVENYTPALGMRYTPWTSVQDKSTYETTAFFWFTALHNEQGMFFINTSAVTCTA